MDFIKETERFIKEEELLRKGETIVVGVSGGADSICLLEVLCALAGKWRWNLIPVHVDHGIRGEEAEADAAFVGDFCDKKGLDSHIYHVNIPEFAKLQGMGLEEAGRLVRRTVFEKEMMEASSSGRKIRLASIALAHQAEDCAETFVMNVCRGTGVNGLAGIRPDNPPYVHPLLWARRAQIEDFLLERGISWREDSSNGSDDYTRNRIRHRLLPLLEKEINSRAVDHIVGIAEQMRELGDYLERETFHLQMLYTDSSEGQIRIDKDVLEEDGFLLSNLVRTVLIEAAGCAKDIERRHVLAVIDLLEGGTGRARNLPYGLVAVSDYDGVSIAKKGEKEEEGRPFFATNRLIRPEDCPDYKRTSPYTKYFDYDIIGEQSIFRTRKNGDYIVIDAEGHSQKVADWMVNHKILREERKKIMLLADGHHVYWIVGYRQSEDSLVTDKTKTVIEWRIKESDEF